MTEFPLTFRPSLGAPLGQCDIRVTHEDFYVEEILPEAPSGTGEHLYLWVEKNGANTGWVAERLAEHFGLRHFDVGYAGRKDRHAVTRQWFSIWLPKHPDAEWQNISLEGVDILEGIWHTKKLRTGDHIGNLFRLRLSNVSLTGQLCELEERLQDIVKYGMANYFGAQRFGREGNNLCTALKLFDGEKVARKQKGMAISAARSYLFNLELQEALDQKNWREQEGWLQGGAPHRDIDVPLPAPEYESWRRGLETLGVKADKRPFCVVPEALEWHWQENDLLLQFQLPSGSFATSLLEELLIYKDVQLG